MGKRGRPRMDLPLAEILAELSRHGSLTRACADVGVCDRTVFRRMRQDPEVNEAVTAAREAGRDSTFRHGRPGSRRVCACDECRFTDAARREKWRQATSATPCPECGRLIGERGGRRYAHHSAPGVVCPESASSHGSVTARSA